MRHLLNTLYVLTPGSYVFCENEAVAIKVGGTEKVRLPAAGLSSILCFGNTTVSTPLIAFCAKHGILLAFFSDYGRYYGQFQGTANGSVLLRQRQFLSAADPMFACRTAAQILCGKLLNERNQLQRAGREVSDPAAAAALKGSAAHVTAIAQQLQEPSDVNILRGLEGSAATLYFAQFDAMLHAKDFSLRFEVRSRRPPQNEVNAALSFSYALLKSDIIAGLEAVGLDPACGFLHTLRPGRPALALDLMEELRAPLCDRFVLAQFNRGQLQAKDFAQSDDGYSLRDNARRAFLSSWQERKKQTIHHPFLGETVEIGLLPFIQAQLFARYLRGDLDEYPPFLWR